MAFLDSGGERLGFQLAPATTSQENKPKPGEPYNAPIPGSPLYAQAALAAKTAYQKALARINQQRSGLLRQSGFLADVDEETGAARNVRVDPNSLYGGFQLLNRDQAFRDEASINAGISRGLGAGGGLAAQLRNRTRFDFGKEDADFGSALIEGLAQFQDATTAAANERNSALYQAELDAARLAIQNDDFNPADLTGLDPLPYGDVPAGGAGGNTFVNLLKKAPPKKKVKTNYNPRGYVPGGASKKVATAIQNKARRR